MKNKEGQLQNLYQMRSRISQNKAFYKKFWELYQNAFEHRSLRMFRDIVLSAALFVLAFMASTPLLYVLGGIAALFLFHFISLYGAKDELKKHIKNNADLFAQNMSDLVNISMGLSGFFWDVKVLDKLIKTMSKPNVTDLRAAAQMIYPKQSKHLPIDREKVRNNIYSVATEAANEITAEARAEARAVAKKEQKKTLTKIAAYGFLSGFFADSGTPIDYQSTMDRHNQFEKEMAEQEQAKRAAWQAEQDAKKKREQEERWAREEAAKKAHYAGWMADHSDPGSIRQQQFESDYNYWSSRS